ncbi:MAG TPA: glutamate ABC transporter substrate-binding protein [Actinomycetota bacterium]|nr:glutamate ABC transporter substrate-binding protein [Actinomycetota bacterium]
MRNERWRWLVALLAVLALLGAACGDDGGDGEGTGTGSQNGSESEVEEFPADTTMGKIQERGTLIAGVKYDVPPFGFVDPQTDEVRGFDVDVAQEIADRLGVELDAVEAISDNRIPFLKDGTVDIVASTMTITTDRDVEIDFSEPYYIANGRILVAGDTNDVETLEDLSGRSACTALGSTYEGLLKDVKGVDVQLPETYSECFELIQNGSVDAVVTDDVILTGMIIQDDTLKLVGEDLTVEPYGIGVPEGDSDMQGFVNDVLQELYDNGRYAEIYDEWVGQYTDTEAEIPDMTLEEALKLRPCEELCDQVEKG